MITGISRPLISEMNRISLLVFLLKIKAHDDRYISILPLHLTVCFLTRLRNGINLWTLKDIDVKSCEYKHRLENQFNESCITYSTEYIFLTLTKVT